MSRAFSLAGLLRLRHLQQDQAAGDLAAANALVRAAATRVDETRTALEHLPNSASGSESLSAIAAARASSSSMLTELTALTATAERARVVAQREFDASKAAAVSLEKLEERHVMMTAAEELHAEQAVIDEVASTGWHRRLGGRRSGERVPDAPEGFAGPDPAGLSTSAAGLAGDKA